MGMEKKEDEYTGNEYYYIPFPYYHYPYYIERKGYDADIYLEPQKIREDRDLVLMICKVIKILLRKKLLKDITKEEILGLIEEIIKEI